MQLSTKGRLFGLFYFIVNAGLFKLGGLVQLQSIFVEA